MIPLNEMGTGVLVNTIEHPDLKRIMAILSKQGADRIQYGANFNEDHADYARLMFYKTLALIDKMYLEFPASRDTIVYDFDGLEGFTIRKGVFSPKMAKDSLIWAKYLVESGALRGKTVLEMGSGSGIVGLYCAIHEKIKKITCVDVNCFAVQNALENVIRYALPQNKVKIVQSDLFEKIDKKDRYDVILWSFPWTYLDDEEMIKAVRSVKDEKMKSLINSFIDPHYEKMKMFLTDAVNYLTPEGKIVLLSADFCRNDLLGSFSSKLGISYKCYTISQSKVLVEQPLMVFDLFNLVFQLK